MRLRNLLLGSTALVGAGVLGVGAAPGTASAAEVLPGGALNITLSGFARFRVTGGQLDNQYNQGKGAPGATRPTGADRPNALTTGVDFSNDYEFHVLVSGKHDATGLEYGAHMEFEGDTDSTFNTDEEWLWLRGGFGEFRFGDEDGVVDLDSIGAVHDRGQHGRHRRRRAGAAVDRHGAAVEHEQLDQDQLPLALVRRVPGRPDLHAEQPGAEQRRVERRHGERPPGGGEQRGRGLAGLQGRLRGAGAQASVVGSTGKADGGVIRGPGHNSDTFWTVYGGAATTIFGLKLAGGAGAEDTGGLKRDYFNAGAGLSFGPVNLSINYGKVVDSSGYDANKPWIAIAGFDVGLMPGLVAGAEVAYFDNDLPNRLQTAGSDKGWSWLADLRLAF